jgi:hypothetical protein
VVSLSSGAGESPSTDESTDESRVDDVVVVVTEARDCLDAILADVVADRERARDGGLIAVGEVVKTV